MPPPRAPPVLRKAEVYSAVNAPAGLVAAPLATTTRASAVSRMSTKLLAYDSLGGCGQRERRVGLRILFLGVTT